MILVGDCMAEMLEMAQDSVDAVATDPPSAIGLMGNEWDTFEDRHAFVGWLSARLYAARRVLRFDTGIGAIWGLPKTSHWTGWACEEAGFEVIDRLTHLCASRMPKAKTLLKPAGEDWWLVRHRGSPARLYPENCRLDGAGRLPSNVTLDEEAARLLDAVNPASRSRKGKPRASKKPGNGWGMTKTGTEYDDEGGPSRFFYTSRATSAERDAGLDHENLHPSVKSIRLMRFIIRLISPPGALILDPFAGSGSTGCAAALEHRRFIGIELDPISATDAIVRIEHWKRLAG